MPRDAEKLVDAQSGLVYLLTTPFCSTRSARRKALRGSSNARNRLEVMPKGGLANTRNGWCGHRNSLASHWTTVTGASAKRRRSSLARVLCSSIARTSAPASTRAAVNAPVPAPISMTSSPRRTSELRTILRAHSASSRCQPHRRPARFPDTTHHREDAHVSTIAAHPASANRFSRRSTGPKACRRWRSVLDAGDLYSTLAIFLQRGLQIASGAARRSATPVSRAAALATSPGTTIRFPGAISGRQLGK